MKVSLIISVYKNVQALKAILDALNYQTEKEFEIIITEDGMSSEMANFIAQYQFLQPYIHLPQVDDGWRKNKALNEAIRVAHADWLIFIDGDSVPHPRFIEMHLRYAAEKVIVAGKRVKLSQEASNFLMAHPTHILHMQKLMWRKLLFGKRDGRYLEESVFISPDSLFGFIPRCRSIRHLIGANMSMSRNALYAINGFDEDYKLPAVGEDHDIQWRLEQLGYRLVSVRNMAVQYHLWHPENWTDQTVNLELCAQNKATNRVVCVNGLTKK